MTTSTTLTKEINDFIADTDDSWMIPSNYTQLLEDGKQWLLQSTSPGGRSDAVIESYCRRKCNRRGAYTLLKRALRGYSHGAYKSYSKEASVAMAVETLLIGDKFRLNIYQNILSTYERLHHEFGEYAKEVLSDALLVLASYLQKNLGIYEYEQGSYIDSLTDFYVNHRDAA